MSLNPTPSAIAAVRPQQQQQHGLELQPRTTRHSQLRRDSQARLEDGGFQDDNAARELALEMQQSVQHTFPEGGLAAWLVVAGSAAIIAVTFGLASIVGVLQEYWQTHQLAAYSSSTVGWIGAVNVSLSLLLGVQVGPLFDRYGPRWLMLSGSVMYILGLVLLAQSTKYWQFMITFGLICGVSSAMVVTCAIAAIAHWFEIRRGQANGVAFVGSSLGGIAFPLILRPLLDALGWAWAIRTLALIISVFVIIGNVFVRGRLPVDRRPGKGSIDLRCFGDARFVWATIGISLFEFVLFGSLGLLPTWVVSRGWGAREGGKAVAALNAGSAFGRYLAGHLSDKVGRYNSMALTLVFSVTAVFALWIPLSTTTSKPLLYIFAPLFGFGSGSAISLAPVCFGQLCRASEYGKYYGTGYSIVSFMTLICIPIGGALLPAAGPETFVAFLGGILGVSLIAFTMARWACLDYHWVWRVKI